MRRSKAGVAVVARSGRALRRRDDGMSTAEYAVGTVAAAGLGGLLIKLLTSPEVRDLIWSVLSNAFKAFFS
jgi:hypothetical protein